MKDAAAEVWATDCPLAALQFQQHAGKKPMHPMSILARAYRADGFATRLAEQGNAKRPRSTSQRRGGRYEVTKTVSREEILDFVTYEEQRGTLREAVMRTKAPRRVHVGPHLTFLFENHDTMRYQVQEMVRTERMVKEADIRHELETYNELLGGRGELGATLLIELEDPAQRAEKLTQWLALPKHLYALRADGKKAYARFDEPAGWRHARLVGAVPEIRGGGPGTRRDRLRPPGPRAAPRDGAHGRAARRAAARPFGVKLHILTSGPRDEVYRHQRTITPAYMRRSEQSQTACAKAHAPLSRDELAPALGAALACRTRKAVTASAATNQRRVV